MSWDPIGTTGGSNGSAPGSATRTGRVLAGVASPPELSEVNDTEVVIGVPFTDIPVIAILYCSMPSAGVHTLFQYGTAPAPWAVLANTVLPPKL